MQERIQERAVVDRFGGRYAVLLVGDVQRPLDVPRQQLPHGVKEGTWLLVELANDVLVSARIDAVATEEARQRIQEKLERLRRGDHLKE